MLLIRRLLALGRGLLQQQTFACLLYVFAVCTVFFTTAVFQISTLVGSY